MYIEKWMFWAIVIAIACVFFSVRTLKREIDNVKRSGEECSYKLRICLRRKGAEQILRDLKLESIMDDKNTNASLLFLGADCQWFTNGTFIQKAGYKNRTLFYAQIAGKKGDEFNEWDGPGAAFGITERFDKQKGWYLSLDIFYKNYPENSLIYNDFQRIHLGEFPVPPAHHKWDEPMLNRVSEYGWQAEKHDDHHEYMDKFGETQYLADPPCYENKFIRVELD